MVIQPAPSRKRIRRLICRWRGHRWRNYGVFMRMKVPGDAWRTVQAKRGVDVCERCGERGAVEVRATGEEVLIDSVWAGPNG